MPSTNPGQVLSGKRGILEAYMNYNPCYHFLEIIRSPLMNNPVAPLTLIFVGVTTVLGFALAAFMYSRYRHMVVLWS